MQNSGFLIKIKVGQDEKGMWNQWNDCIVEIDRKGIRRVLSR